LHLLLHSGLLRISPLINRLFQSVLRLTHPVVNRF
jgi:hypothetical protein